MRTCLSTKSTKQRLLVTVEWYEVAGLRPAPSRMGPLGAWSARQIESINQSMRRLRMIFGMVEMPHRSARRVLAALATLYE